MDKKNLIIKLFKSLRGEKDLLFKSGNSLKRMELRGEKYQHLVINDGPVLNTIIIIIL
jgi:hypothetical protein